MLFYVPSIFTSPITKSKYPIVDEKQVKVQNNDTDIKWSIHNTDTQQNKNTHIFDNTNEKKDTFLQQYVPSQSIYFDCKSPTDERCLKGIFTMKNLKVNETYSITLSFSINMENIDKLTRGWKNAFVIFTTIDVKQTSDDNWYVSIVD